MSATEVTLNDFRQFIISQGVIKFLSSTLITCISTPDKTPLILLNPSDDRRDLITNDNKIHVVNIMMSGNHPHNIAEFINSVIDYDIDDNFNKIYELKIVDSKIEG